MDIDNESLVSLLCSKNNLSSLPTYIYIPRTGELPGPGSDPRRRILSA